MTYTEFVRRAVSVVAIVILVILLLLLVNQVMSIIMMGYLCWIISVGLDVPITALKRLGLHNRGSIALTLLSTLLVILLFIVIVLPPVINQMADMIGVLPEAVEWLVVQYGELRLSDPALTELLPEFTLADFYLLFEVNPAEVPTDEEIVDIGAILQSAVPILVDVGSFVANSALNVLMVVIISLYLVLDPLIYYRIIVAMVPLNYEHRAITVINDLRHVVVSWLSALAVSMSFTGVAVFVVVGVVLGVPNALALSALAALANIIPYIGYWLALIPIGLFALVAAGPTTAVIAVIAYVIIGEVESKFVSPTVINNELHIPAGLTLLFQLIAAATLGFMGIVLAVPTLALISVLVKDLYVQDQLGKWHIPLVTQSVKDGRLHLNRETAPAETAEVGVQRDLIEHPS